MHVLGVTAAMLAAVVALGSSPAFGYGPQPHTPVISISASVVAPGGTLTVDGQNFTPDAAVDLSLHSAVVQLGTVTPDGQGRFSTSITVPADTAPGSHALEARDVPTNDVASALITVLAVEGDGSGPPQGGGGLAGTGVAVAGLLALALGLLLSGRALTFAGRRRRAQV